MKLPKIATLFNYNIERVKSLAGQLAIDIKTRQKPKDTLHRWYDFFLPSDPRAEVMPRLEDKKYMSRKLLRLIKSELLYAEQKEKEIGGKSGGAYCGERSLKFRKLQNDYNTALLESRGIVKNGKKIPLAKLTRTAEKKFAEMYVAVKGLEALSEEMGHKWALVTLTAPARFHPNPTKGSSSWNGSNARVAHEYLNGKWKLFRAALNDYDISVSNNDIFGIVVTEPHKDGSPHWHILTFYKSEFEERISELFNRFFADESEHAVDFKVGEPDREDAASASSYVAKYIMKALGVEDCVITTSEEQIKQKLVKQAVERIEVWRSATGIRAYRFFGVKASITKWRLFRKIQNLRNKNELNIQLAMPFHKTSDDQMYIGEISKSKVNWQKIYREKAIIENSIKHATENNFKEFLKEFSKIDKLEMMTKEVEDRYGKPTRKEYGIKIGHQAILFTQYEIIDIKTEEKDEKQLASENPTLIHSYPSSSTSTPSAKVCAKPSTPKSKNDDKWLDELLRLIE